MDRFGLATLASQKQVKQQAQAAFLYINQNGQFSKKNASEFLDAIYVELTSMETSSLSKTMTIHIIKEMTYQAQARFFSLLSGHKLLQFLFNEAKNIDPKKNVNEKGLKKFNNLEHGKQYMRTLLEILNFWGEKFAKGKNSEPTKYKKSLTELKNLGVILPQSYEIFDPNEYKNKSKKTKQGFHNEGEVQQSIPAMMKSAQYAIKPGKLKVELEYTKQKIYIFYEELEQNDDQEKLQSLIKTNHFFFDKERGKYSDRQAQLDQNLINDYSSIQYFLSEQSKFYSEFVPQNEWSSYITNIKILIQSTFENNFKSKSKNQINRQITVKESLPNSDSKIMNDLSSRARPSLDVAKSTTPNARLLISDLYSRLQQRSKSPNTGFKSVQMNLGKQIEQARLKSGKKPSKSPRNLLKSETTLGKSNVSINIKESRINQIFMNPPNPNPSFKVYEGELVKQSQLLNSAIYNMKKQQGSRRFKISNFRQKNPLFENEHIQIGYKSQSVYEHIQGFDNFVLLNIFIGNKTQETVKDFQADYKSDNQQVLYANPRNLDSLIPPGYQNKQDLMITPINAPYNLITMNIRYKFHDCNYVTSVILPNSVLKFASYMNNIKRSDLQSGWRSGKILKTNPFRLCKHFPPESLIKWIPALENLTKYSDFCKAGSETDLQMFCLVIMLQKYEAFVKINVRPNIEVVLQMSVLDSSKEGLQYCKFYLETLELMLKEIQI